MRIAADLCIICNSELLDKQGCNGAPDWIIEILSKDNSKKELKIKYELYQQSGVTEYWLVYPYEQTVHQFILSEQNVYELKNMYTTEDTAVPYLFPELSIDLTEVF